MADEDEIDVLGDYNLNNFLSKSDVISFEESSLISENNDLLNCEYTIHPQWLLDKPSTNPDNWYNTNSSTELTEKIQIDNDSLGHLSTENCITDESGWTEKEKTLLERGIEIFGKSNVRLAQFVGSKTSAEVRYYLKNFYTENHPKINNDSDIGSLGIKGDVLDEKQIPASIEEVIAAVSTGKPTVSRNYKKFSSSSENSDHSPTKSFISHGSVKNKEGKKAKYSINKSKSCNNRLGKIKVKFKSSIKLSKYAENKPKHYRKIPRDQNVNQTDNLLMRKEITTGKGLAVPVSEGEEIVRLEKVDDDEDDIEVDVDLSDDDDTTVQHIKEHIEKTIHKEKHSGGHTSLSQLKPNNTFSDKTAKSESKVVNVLSKLDADTFQQISSLEVPKCEIILDSHHISQLEKVINWDYFEGGQSKTPQRYLKIRTHMINMWLNQKPKYLHKTSSRQGLKNCGDVNDVGRIHQLLEQMGVINFGCEQVKYLRPLTNMIYSQPLSKEKPPKANKNNSRPIGELGVRQRIKKKFIQDGEGGCTLTHGEQGEVIHTTVVNEEPPVPKPKVYIKKPSIRLIYCRPFTEEKPQPYSIKMHLASILTMDFHAHLSSTEVMGLVGGYWIPQSKSMVISHYEPCLNIASSAIHCDMCPISQAKASDIIYSKELVILGWFHSHPTFAPEPSQQDLETQQTVQKWIGHKKPCIGVILSPFSANGALIASPYRCLTVGMNAENQLVPYKFNVDIVADNFDIKNLLQDLMKVRNSHLSSADSGKIDFAKPYFLDSSITHLDKFITSVRMQLAKSGTFDKMTCDSIIQGITHLIDRN